MSKTWKELADTYSTTAVRESQTPSMKAKIANRKLIEDKIEDLKLKRVFEDYGYFDKSLNEGGDL